MKDLQHILITNLMALRKERGLTQIELGEQVNYSDKTISKWENGDSCPNIEAVYRLAAFYGVSIDALLREDFSAEEPVVPTPVHEKPKPRYNRSVIGMLAIMVVWAVASLLFTIFRMTPIGVMAWTVFPWAVPASLIVALIFNSLWGNRRKNYLIISLFVWSLLASLVFTVVFPLLWPLLLLGVPAQIAIILWSQLKRKK
jgi:transcriptional regulator with XRE-family HTH domain